MPLGRTGVAALMAGVTLCAVVAAGASSAGEQRAQTAAVRLVQVGRFDGPTYVTAPPGDEERVFVVERRGSIRVVRDGRKLGKPFLDISSEVVCCGERGLLSMAFPPDYETSRLVYAYFTRNGGDITIREYRTSAGDPDVAERGSARTVLVQNHPRVNHNGGQLQFGPDGFLYAALGDGGGAGDPGNNAQDLGTLLGKALRIDPRRSGGRPYRVPRSNPFRGRRGARPQIYAYGLRNPWRFSFDRATGDFTLGDVGQDAVEEVNFAREGGARGKNFGWPRREGRRSFRGGPVSRYVPPVLQRFHSLGACTVIGGYVVRDRDLDDLYGRYVYGDLCDAALRSARLSTGRARDDKRVGVSVRSLVSFGEDALGRVYAVSLRGPVYRLAAR